jgi:hypothetical protein
MTLLQETTPPDRCDHCEEEIAPEALVILAPPVGDGEWVCARCIKVMLYRAIAKLPRVC